MHDIINYQPIHFKIEELVPKIFLKHSKQRLLQLLDPRALYTLDRIRERYGVSVIVNNYLWNGKLQNRGLRDFGTIPKGGSNLSQHFFGRAFDCDVKGYTAEQIRNDISRNIWHSDFIYITCIESDTNWLHFDCRNWDKRNNGLLIVKP